MSNKVGRNWKGLGVHNPSPIYQKFNMRPIRDSFLP